jgi:hypothetical protein
MPFVDGLSVRDSLDALRRGLIPYWCNDPTGGRKPINGKCETVDRLPTFREAYGRRRCTVPVDGFSNGRRSGGESQAALRPEIAWTRPKRRSGRPLQAPVACLSLVSAVRVNHTGPRCKIALKEQKFGANEQVLGPDQNDLMVWNGPELSPCMPRVPIGIDNKGLEYDPIQS